MVLRSLSRCTASDEREIFVCGSMRRGRSLAETRQVLADAAAANAFTARGAFSPSRPIISASFEHIVRHRVRAFVVTACVRAAYRIDEFHHVFLGSKSALCSTVQIRDRAVDSASREASTGRRDR